jgi:hypothetical protein
MTRPTMTRLWAATYGAAFANMAMNPSKNSYDSVDREARRLATEADQLHPDDGIPALLQCRRIVWAAAYGAAFAHMAMNPAAEGDYSKVDLEAGQIANQAAKQALCG